MQPSPIILKPRLANSFAMVLGGLVLTIGGFGMWKLIGGFYGLIPGVFGTMGVFWVLAGSLALARRNSLVVTIGDCGIDVPCHGLLEKAKPRTLIGRDNISMVTKDESINGRRIKIIRTTACPVWLEARHYCELDQFLAHCRKYGLPVA